LTGLTAGQCAEPVEIHGVLAAHGKISIQELGVALFIERVAADVLRSVGIELLQSQLVWVLGAGSYSAEFRVLLPKVGFDEFRSCEESKNCGITSVELLSVSVCQQICAAEGGHAGDCSACAESAFEERTSVIAVRCFIFLFHVFNRMMKK
jgi:hypothetical protein